MAEPLAARFWGAVLHRSTRICTALRRRIARDHLFRPRPDDLFLAAYPGSGEPVARLMIHRLFAGVADPRAEDPGQVSFPHVESVFPSYSDLVEMDEAAWLETLPSPRLLLSRDLPHHLPAGVRVVYLVDDPRRVARACFHRYALLSGVDADFAPWFEVFLAGHLPFGSWFDYTRAWWPRRHDDGVLFLTLHQLLDEPEATVRRLADFCGVEVGDRVAAIVAGSRPEVVRRHRDRFDPRLRRLDRDAEVAFVRRGRSGGGRDAFSPRQEEKLRRRLRALAHRLDGFADDPRGRRLLGLLDRSGAGDGS